MAQVEPSKSKQHEDFRFWRTQPVPRIDERIETDINEEIESNKQIDEIRKDPIALPANFEWCTLDLASDGHMAELQALLEENYVEDVGSSFRFQYSKELLEWALMPPGYLKDWHVGIRASTNNKLLAFIGSTPMTVRIYDKIRKSVEINFLCVHKKLRSKRLAPVLIKEITRRVNMTGIFQAVYTSGTYLPKPITEASYYHRSINPKKLIEIQFSYLRKNMTLARTIKLYKLPAHPQIPGFREMQPQDLEQVFALYQKSMSKMDFHQVMTLEEARHFLLPCNNALHSYVVETGDEKQITAFISFYTIHNQVLNNPNHNVMKAAYLWFYYSDGDEMLTRIVNDALICARNTDHDVMNCVEVMDNHKFLDDLKFKLGDGKLNYYLFNWRCQSVEKSKQGFVVI